MSICKVKTRLSNYARIYVYVMKVGLKVLIQNVRKVNILTFRKWHIRYIPFTSNDDGTSTEANCARNRSGLYLLTVHFSNYRSVNQSR